MDDVSREKVADFQVWHDHESTTIINVSPNADGVGRGSDEPSHDCMGAKSITSKHSARSTIPQSPRATAKPARRSLLPIPRTPYQTSRPCEILNSSASKNLMSRGNAVANWNISRNSQGTLNEFVKSGNGFAKRAQACPSATTSAIHKKTIPRTVMKLATLSRLSKPLHATPLQTVKIARTAITLEEKSNTPSPPPTNIQHPKSSCDIKSSISPPPYTEFSTMTRLGPVQNSSNAPTEELQRELRLLPGLRKRIDELQKMVNNLECKQTVYVHNEKRMLLELQGASQMVLAAEEKESDLQNEVDLLKSQLRWLDQRRVEMGKEIAGKTEVLAGLMEQLGTKAERLISGGGWGEDESGNGIASTFTRPDRLEMTAVVERMLSMHGCPCVLDESSVLEALGILLELTERRKEIDGWRNGVLYELKIMLDGLIVSP